MDFAEALCSWFLVNKREMPWRNTRDPYRIWVSEVMLQQTQVDTVIPYYNRFMERFPDIESLAAAPQEEVYRFWQGLGYYRRASNLHNGAKRIHADYDGVFPAEPEKASKIPGIGPYTLGAVLSISHNLPLPAVDGNVMRVISRQFKIEEDITLAGTRKTFESLVLKLMTQEPRIFNQALMELGALICTPKNPKCLTCPVAAFCMAREEEVTGLYPVKSKKAPVEKEKYRILAAVIKDEMQGARLWLEKREEKGLLADLWGFPMVTEKMWKAVYEKLFLKPGVKWKALKQVNHVFSHRKWEMVPVVMEFIPEHEELLRDLDKWAFKEDAFEEGGAQYVLSGQASRSRKKGFFAEAELDALPMGTAHKKMLPQILEAAVLK